MPRQTKSIIDFTKGMVIKSNPIGDISILRLRGYHIDKKLGILATCGGWEHWSTPASFLEINGIYRWYDEDGGATFFIFGNGAIYGIFQYFLEDKTTLALQGDTSFDRNSPVLWINCDSQVVVLSDGKQDAPYSIKLLKKGVLRFATVKLGLQPSADDIQVAATGHSTPSTWIEGNGEYSWAITYSYGTPDAPEKYGESGLSKIVTLFLPTVSGSYDAVIDVVTPISGFITRINIYRTLKDGVTFYKIGYIDEIGRITFTDNFNDSTVDTSKTAPTQFGLPGVIRCGKWYNQRLYYFGNNGTLRWSAAGYPDIHPATFYTIVGNNGFRGTWIGVIRDNIYVGKEDGIYIILGSPPNHIPKKVSDIRCMSRASMVEMPDAIYFLGLDGDETKVYRFDGYNPVPVSMAISDILLYSNQDVHKRAFGIRVGYEYWLSICTYATRASRWPNPFNNVILVYNTITNGWFIHAGQIAAFTTMSGTQDNEELYGCEADPASDVNKGQLYKWCNNLGTASFTNYLFGSPSRSKTLTHLRDITLGLSAGMAEGRPFQKVTPQTLKIRYRGSLQLDPILTIFTDSFTIQKSLLGNINPESSTTLADIDTVGTDAPVFDTGEWNSGAAYEDRVLEERLFNITDVLLRTGHILNVSLSFANSRFIEIEALELKYDITEEE